MTLFMSDDYAEARPSTSSGLSVLVTEGGASRTQTGWSS